MVNSMVNVNDFKYKQSLYKSHQKINQYIDHLLNKFNEWIGPELKYFKQDEPPKHKVLLELIDKKYLCKYYQIADDYDKARIKSISSNGASSWLDTVPNNLYGQKYSNLECYILLSVYLGSDIMMTDAICNKCKQKVGKKAYHALYCQWEKYLTRTHNSIRNELNKWIKTAGLNTQIEQKYEDIDNQKIKVKGIPGDIKIMQYDNMSGIDLYLDVVVGNVFAESYVKSAARERLWMAKEKEKQKLNKYNNEDNIKPMALESMGAMGPCFKKMIQDIAHRISERKNKPFSIILNRIRTRIIAILMKYNSSMIFSCIYT